MKIGLVTDFYYPWVGGPASLIRNLAHGLATRGHEVSILAPSATGTRSTEPDGPATLYRVPTVPVPFGYQLRTALWPRRDVGDWMDAVRPEVVHVHHPFPLSATAVFTARSRSVPLVATNHTIPACSLWGMRNLGPVYGLAHDSLARWIVHLLNQCDSVATPTPTAARLLQELGFDKTIRSISNGVDSQRFSPGPADGDLRRRLRLDERPVVLYTGRLDAEKAMDVWLAAAAAIPASDAQFLVGGQGAEREPLEKLASELGLTGRIHFMGYLDAEEFPSVYRLADVYFITSPVELQSISTLEAIASALPVVAVRAGALPELVREGENGFLIDPGDSGAAAARLARLLPDTGMRESMGAASREIALEHDLSASLTAYESFLRQAVEAGGAKKDG